MELKRDIVKREGKRTVEREKEETISEGRRIKSERKERERGRVEKKMRIKLTRNKREKRISSVEEKE